MSKQWEIDIIFNICFTIVPPGLDPPVSEENPLSEANLKSLPSFF